MKKVQNIEFLRERINQIKTALCTTRYPVFSKSSHIIRTKYIDEDGNIYFNLIDTLPKATFNTLGTFNLKLLFYQQNPGCYLKIDAIASPVIPEANSDDGLLFVKATILSASYSEVSNTIGIHQYGGMKQKEVGL